LQQHFTVSYLGLGLTDLRFLGLKTEINLFQCHDISFQFYDEKVQNVVHVYIVHLLFYWQTR